MRLILKQLAQAIKESKKIAIVSGAGVSTESGIPDFRSSTGLYTNGMSRERLLSKSYSESNPKKFWFHYKDIFKTKLIDKFLPNYGHNFLVELELMGKDVSIFTQNVDGLHTDAGSSKVYEMHGSIKSAFCVKCAATYDLNYINSTEIPRCNKINGKGNICNFILKPSVVLFGDQIKYGYQSIEEILKSDLLIVLGSSLNVEPVAELPIHFAKGFYKEGNRILYKATNPDRKLAIINYEATELDNIFDIVIHDAIGKTCNEIYNLLNA